MESLAANLPLSIRVVFGIATVVSSLLLLRAGIRFIVTIVRHKLPRPFLGDGSNVEWAEQKRSEIAAGGFSYDPKMIDDAGHSHGDVSNGDPEIALREVSIRGNENRSEKNSSGSLNSI